MTTATAARTVLLTGADNPLGKIVLKRFGSAPDVGRILTASDGPPTRGRKVRHLKVDPASEKVVDFLQKEKVDTIVHLESVSPHGEGESAFERNVLSTMTLLGAAAEASVRHVILRSSYSVYGAQHTNPNFIPETRKARGEVAGSLHRNVVDVERYAQEFLKNFTEIGLTILRFAHIVGPTFNSRFMQYLKLPVCPILLGFDPLFQLLHEEDAADAVLAALRSDAFGPVNIAPNGVVPLLKILRFLKKEMMGIPHLPLNASERLLSTLKKLPFDAGFLRFSCCLENERMKTELGFVPKRTSGETLRALRTEA